MDRKDMDSETYFNLKMKENKSSGKKNKKEKKGKRLLTGIIAMLLICATALTFGLFKKKNKDKSDDKSLNPTISVDNSKPYGVDLDNLGQKIDFDKENLDRPNYGKTTGNVNVGDIVVGPDGTYWVNQDALDKSDNLGEIVDTNNGEFVIGDDGNVHDPNSGYEVVDKEGNVVDSGEGNIPEGYAWDENLGCYLPIDQVGKYMYDENGDIVPIVDYNENNISTEPIQEETIATEEVTTGHYIDSYGNEWASYQDYLNGLENPDGIYYSADDNCLHCNSKTNDNTDSYEDSELSKGYQLTLGRM